jgi:predicted phosphodiesterase
MPQPPTQPQPETMALRFRDFGVDTIAEHNAIAAERGRVWWGWWNKPQERMPRAVLASFEQAIQQTGPLQIFLVDSGMERLFTVRLRGIAVAPGLQEDARIPPPEPELAPAYYRDREWRVWFEFEGEIEQLLDEAIREFSYSEVPAEVFVDEPQMERYDGKRVYSVREMLGRRHRTIYFLRRYQEGDPEYEIQLAVPDYPVPFSTIAHATRSNLIVLLSDLHFSADRANHEFALVSQAGDADLLEVLDEDIRSNFGDLQPAAVILSGDLTWKGDADEFEYARRFVSRLHSIWGLDWSQILTIPGNHDITWTGAPGAAGLPAGAEAESAYRTFVSQGLRFNPNEHLSMGRRFLLDNFIPVDVLALNSVRLESETYRGFGFVGPDQLEHGFNAMGWEKGSEPGPKLRILALHHHVVPVVPLEKPGAQSYSLTLDAGELLYRALEHGVDIVIHGHQHKPFAAGYSRMIPRATAVSSRLLAIHGAGSIGVAASKLPAGVRNAYTMLRVDGDGIDVLVRDRSEEHGHAFRDGWTARLDRTPHGYRAMELR